jgi:uncharacterized protein (DUF952 family)
MVSCRLAVSHLISATATKLCLQRGLTLWRRDYFPGIPRLAGAGQTPLQTEPNRRQTSPMPYIYKIVDEIQWEQSVQVGEFTGAEIDKTDGFIHFSDASQVAATLEKHFKGIGGLLLISVDADLLGDALKWEVSRGGELFPHLYGSLPMSAVVAQTPLPLLDDGTHRITGV